jgi:hypothetical protein
VETPEDSGESDEPGCSVLAAGLGAVLLLVLLLVLVLVLNELWLRSHGWTIEGHPREVSARSFCLA